MVTGLKVLHCNKKSIGELGDPWFNWQTCLRQIALGHQDWDLQTQHPVQVYHGKDAYRFLLEIGCGLHSPMVGETEVFGQFRKLVDEVKSSSHSAHAWLADVLEQIRLDIKKIRARHLVGLGSQSYGSLIRKKTKSADGVSIIGGGHLAQEILPWLAKHPGSVSVLVRNLEKHEQSQQEFAFAQWLDLHHSEALENLQPAVVVAAPMTGVEITAKLKASPEKPSVVYDLRGEAEDDPISDEFAVETLNQLFSQIQYHRKQAEQKISMAKSVISELTK